MKKFAAILMATLMMASFVGCGGNNGATEETKPQETVAETAEETVAETTEASSEDDGELSVGDEGEGEKVLDSKLASVTIPAGFKYKIYTYAMVDDTNGTIDIDFGKSSASEARLTVSTQRMVNSLDEVEERAIELRNLDTYKEGKSEVGEDVTFGDVTYRRISISNEYGSDELLVGYVKTGAGLGAYIEINLEGIGGLTFDDAEVKSIIESIQYK